ncbi:MAG: ATP-binding protein [Acetobacteraceae bacterium]
MAPVRAQSPQPAPFIPNQYILLLEDAPVAARFASREQMRTAAAVAYRQQVETKQAAVLKELAARNIRVLGSVSVLVNAIFVSAPASRVAEQRAAQILSQTRELRDYSQRFAFVLHDIKNVSGQLSMLLANAEVHADNPEFQRDMLATVRASVGKITRLLSRLQADRQERSHALIDPVERLKDIIATTLDAGPAGVAIVGLSPDTARTSQLGGVAIDAEAFDAVAAHLLNNAIEASPPGQQVRVEVRREALSVVIDIIDAGSGMTPEFIRDELFRPFASTRRDGHGIGAYQARELLREAGGDLLVLSRVGSGTTMRLLLPMVQAAAADTPQYAA